MERIESTHSIWLFDAERMRFRRVPKGSDADSPSLDSDWEPYFALDVDHETGAFTVALNEDRTRLLRGATTSRPRTAPRASSDSNPAPRSDRPPIRWQAS